MKKIIKEKIFLCLIVGICCLGVGVYAGTKYPYQASDVAYTPSNGETINVNEALNEIYSIKTLGDATEEDIAQGKTAIVQGKLITGINYANSQIINLGTGTSFDVSDYEGYENFTADNFITTGEISGSGSTSVNTVGSATAKISYIKEYSSTEGILTAYSKLYYSVVGGNGSNSSTKKISVNAYLILQ